MTAKATADPGKQELLITREFSRRSLIIGSWVPQTPSLRCWSSSSRGVTVFPHRFDPDFLLSILERKSGEYRLGKRKILHIHGDNLVDLPLPKKVRDEFIASDRAKPRHVLPEQLDPVVVIRSLQNFSPLPTF